MQTATSETESKSRDLSLCVHHYTLRAPCPKGQGNRVKKRSMNASHVISVAVKKARAVAANAQSVTIIHLCPRCVVPRIVVGHVCAILSDSRHVRAIPWPSGGVLTGSGGARLSMSGHV